MFLVYLVYGTMIVAAKVRIKRRIYKKNAPAGCLELRNYSHFGIIIGAFWTFVIILFCTFVPLIQNDII